MRLIGNGSRFDCRACIPFCWVISLFSGSTLETFYTTIAYLNCISCKNPSVGICPFGGSTYEILYVY